ncbi:MAG TPA: sigma-70 family RNA polymerase sigma factor [Micromonosporaceae bacterium]|nr:sigma-70 family RNA polymerase sigma factor [Micromonosporaceae bacterium]
MEGTHPARSSDQPGSPHGEVAELVRLAADGDQRAWNELVDRFTGLLWSVCRSHRLSNADAADALQQTWLRLLEHLDSIHQPERLAAWLATTCRRECLAILRRGKRSVTTDDERLLDHLAGQTPGADQSSLISDRNAGLWRAFSRLSPRCQEVLRVLVVAAGADRPSYDVVAAALGMPVGSLGPTRARCLEQLRKPLDAEGITVATTDS